MADQLRAKPDDLVALFVSPLADTYRIARQAAQAFPGVTVVGCTTAGEITHEGYSTGEIVAVCFPAGLFAHETFLIEDLRQMDPHVLAYRTLQARANLERRAPNWDTEFAFSLIDGLSLAEDHFMGALAQTMGPVPLFGGSAGDDIDFHQAFVLFDGQAHANAAVLTLVRTACRVQVFKLDHLLPTGAQMVVTGADPAARVVHEINAEPAGREYARILRKDPNQLSPMTFAAHPLLVRIGDQHHVRAIQRVTDDGKLVFFSAIDEGVVLSLAEALPIVDHLENALNDLARPSQPSHILAFDCILRRIEAEQRQSAGQMSNILARHNVIGFNTFGEQYHGTHVNQTMTGAAIYPPDT
ncbi:MAG: FIST N-terminal domain-containing protein [Pseudomonadota bacterium]